MRLRLTRPPFPKGGRSWAPAPRGRRAGGDRSAFTLMELLVVVAIIAVLAALLLPVLASAKAKARSFECLSRQREWVRAFIMYSSEHEEGMIPREGFGPAVGQVVLNNWTQIRGRPVGTDGRDTDDVWYNALPPLLDRDATHRYAQPVPRRLEFYERANLIHCPSARFPTEVRYFTYQFALFSIAMNSHLIREGEGPSIKFSLIENHDPTRMVLFQDNLLEGEEKVDPAQEDQDLGQPASFADRFSPRHSKGGNLAFADGHAAWFAGPKVVETNPFSERRGGPIEPAREIVWELPYSEVVPTTPPR